MQLTKSSVNVKHKSLKGQFVQVDCSRKANVSYRAEAELQKSSVGFFDVILQQTKLEDSENYSSLRKWRVFSNVSKAILEVNIFLVILVTPVFISLALLMIL